MKNKYLFLATLFIPMVSVAQVDPSEEVMDEIIINENRLQIPFQQSTRNTQVITKEDIKKLPVSSLNEILAYVSGVDIRQRGPFGSQADISIDGGSFEQTMVLWNGVKMSDAQTAHHSMNLPIPLEAIERIEVLKGPAARVYGINALTGAVNIVTKASIDNFIQIHAYAGSSFKDKEAGDGSGMYAGGGVQATAGVNTGKTSHLLSIGKEDYNGQRYNTASDNLKAMYQGNFNVNDANAIQWMGGYINNEFGANGYYAAPHDKESYELVETLLLSVGSTHRITDKLTIKPRISNRYNEDDYRFYRNDLSKARSLHYSNAFMFELNGSYTTDFGDFGVGYEMRLEDINSSNLGAHDRKNHGWFAEYKNTFYDKLVVNVGAYWNYNTDYGFQWYPGADVAYWFHTDWKLQASVGSSQRIPSFTDLYLNQRPGNIGNPNLKPEAAWQYELGVHYNKNNKRLVVSAFQRNISDFIDWTRVSADVPYQPQNLGNHNIKGFNVRYNQDIQVAANQTLAYTLSYQYLSPKKEDVSGVLSKYSIESLKHQAIVGLHYKYNNFGVQFQNRYVKRELNKGYFVSDLKLMYQFNKIETYLQGTNLFNSTYKEVAAVPMPSRWIQLGATYKLNFNN
ncbi:TonB-dependent receptor [Flavobacterium sp. xlx-214]|uniref:TonB-dependent receptor plug domain-containing protein n=1 Tax=unclassified Flavobacterium TaxID=196869 RepID=UPI0013D64364|nr:MULTISPECIES: TonB-dependent receptor [unclassified Flavobacterium]MBA5791970.1 TonB-dependent receptor [Flavobacterium sp. xlx-221]QMI84224.1 TonB-dependent receptor [Flavobacterium sp. xlx-214]